MEAPIEETEEMPPSASASTSNADRNMKKNSSGARRSANNRHSANTKLMKLDVTALPKGP
jgi:hypothetical protein